MLNKALILSLSVFIASSSLSLYAQTVFQVKPQRDVSIRARDGIKLSTDIYFPVVEGKGMLVEPFPVLLHRTPYGKHRTGLVEQAQFFASNGYVVAVQDMRGRFASEGTFSKYHDFDVYDGYDTVEWLASQSFSDGKVGMWGTSYGAHTQADASKMNPPSLGPLVLNQGGMSNAWNHAVRHGGAFEVGRELTWAFRYIPVEVQDPVVKKAFEATSVIAWYDSLPLRKGLSPLSLAPNFESYFLNEATHSDYDAFWKRLGLNWEEYYDQTADVPMLHVGGWFDIFLRGTIKNYVELSARKTSPIRLLIGPWNHGGNARTYAGGVDFGLEAAIEDFGTTFHLNWFDYFLKGKPNSVGSDSPARIFIMGTGDGSKDDQGRLSHGGYWYEASAWPLENVHYSRFYLQHDGKLSKVLPAEEKASTTYTHDPSHPVPTIGGAVSSRVKDGAFNQRESRDFPGSRSPYLPLKARDDVVVFQTEPLEQDITVVGPIEVRIFASSSAVDTDFTAKLIDVYPPSTDFPSGFDMNLTDALVRASYRGQRHKRSLISPSEVYEFVIRPFATANVFKKGHRIRVDISSSNFPRFDVNPGTGEPLGKNRRSIKAENTIHHDSQYPSHILLPIFDREY